MNAIRMAFATGLASFCVMAGPHARAENVGCMVYNNGLRFTEQELQRLEAAREIQYVGVQMGAPAPHGREVAARLARSGKKLILQIWWGSWSRFSFANIAMDPKIRADFFREIVDPIIESVGPEHIHAAHMLEETGMQFATDEQEAGEPENLLDGGGGGYASPFYTGWSGADTYGGPWILSLRRHNQDFQRFSGYDLFEAAIWAGPERSLFRQWVGRRAQALAANRFADHLREKYPSILATTWDGPNFGGNVMADTPAMLNHIDGFTANCYSSPLRNYIFARTLRTLDYDKELEFMSWVGRDNLDANARKTMLASIYAAGSHIIHLWEEPRRCYQRDDLWKVMENLYGTFSTLPVFRHTPGVFVICGGWGIPSRYLKDFDVAHHYDAEGVELGRYRLVLADGAGHPGLKDYVANGGLAVVFGHGPAFLGEERLLIPGDKPVDVSGTYEPDEWWRERFGLAERYKLSVKATLEFAVGKGVRKADRFAYHVPYGSGEVLVLPGSPENDGRDPDWQRLVYDLIKGLLHTNGMDGVSEKHFAPWESGGRYFEITSDDGSVTCYFHYNVAMRSGEAAPEVPPVQVKGIDVLTGNKDPVLGSGLSAAIVAHVPTKPWSPPAVPDRAAILVKPAPKGARRGQPDLPELPPVHSLGPARAVLEPGAAARCVIRPAFDDWAVDECRCRVIVSFKPTGAAPASQPLVLSGKDIYQLTGLANLSWGSVRAFAGGKEVPVQADERDGTGHYRVDGNGRLDYDDELVFAVSLSAGEPATYHLYCDSRPVDRPKWPDADVTFEPISTATADGVLGNGRLTAHLKGPARRPGEHGIENYGAGAITECSLDGKAFTRIRHNWGNLFFSNPWGGDGGWTKPEPIISGPLRLIVRTRLPETIRKDKAGHRTFEASVTHYFAMYSKVPVLDLEQRVDYRWSDKKWSASYTFYTTVGKEPDAKDVLLVPVAGTPQRVSMHDVGVYGHRYLEHRPEQGWMALLDPVEKHGCALFYAKMPEVRENLAWVDYCPRRELTPSVRRWNDGYPMRLDYTNRVMQTDDCIRRSFRIVGLTKEDERAVAAQYLVWGEDLPRLADIEVQLRE